MPFNSKYFGLVISRLRTERDLSQETLSALAGISRSHLVMLENGRKTVRLDTMWRIAPSELIRRLEEQTKNIEI